MKSFLLGFCIALLWLQPALGQSPGDEFVGQVLGVEDGDTLLVKRGDEEVVVRIWGVDCPEKKQPYSQQAKKYTKDLILDKSVRVQIKDTDRKGRLVALVWLDDQSVNEALVSAGVAWWYRIYAPDAQRLAHLELEARKARRGLWARRKLPVVPWKWKKLPGEKKNKRLKRKACCLVCKKGKACGNRCIPRRKKCTQPAGCACQG